MRAGRPAVEAIPELAVVELAGVDVPGTNVVALGVVLSGTPDDDSYTVEVADKRSGTFRRVRVPARRLRIRYAFLAEAPAPF